jgi:hypothetical protein
VLATYVQLMSEGKVDDAYDLLSVTQQAALSRQQFRELAAAQPDEVRHQLRSLQRQTKRPIPVTAEVPLQNGEVATLVLRDGRWHIAQGTAGAATMISPRHTLRALRRALQRRSYPAVVALLGREARAQLEDEVARIVEGLANEEELTVEVTGNRARVRYDGHHVIELERQDGDWVIVNLN